MNKTIEETNAIDFIVPREVYGRIQSDTSFNWNTKAELLSKAYIPGINHFRSTELPREILIQHIESEQTRLQNSDSTLVLHQPWNKTVPLDVFHLLYSISRIKFLEQHQFPVHAACVGNSQGYSLILGHSGAGKTSLGLQLVRDAGFLTFSGNKTLVSFLHGAMEAIAGTSTITIKEEDEWRWEGMIKKPEHYWGRTAFELGKNFYTEDKVVPITQIIFPKFDEHAASTIPMPLDSALHKVYPFFMDQVNANTIVGNTVYAEPTPEGSEQYLVQQLQKSLKHISVVAITGSMDYIVEQILQ